MMVIGGERDYSSVFYNSVTLSSLNGGTIPDCLKNLADFPTTIARGAAAVIGIVGYFLYTVIHLLVVDVACVLFLDHGH